MTTTASHALLNDIHCPSSVGELAEIVRSAAESSLPLYPIGGGTSLEYGLPITRPGAGVQVTGLANVVDYPAADMTVTVQAGIRMAELHRVLQQHQQTLPLDVPSVEEATLGGVIATNFSGPRRAGYGTARDYVIGIQAIDGRGKSFSGGGRVVKNVAGYDFCRMLIGSLGTLGIITEVTLKLKPLAASRQAVVAAPRELEHLETGLAALVTSRTQPVAVNWVRGAGWQSLADQQDWPPANHGVGWLVLVFEGMHSEVDWSVRQIQTEWRHSIDARTAVMDEATSGACLDALTEFPAGESSLLLKANVRPSETVRFVRKLIDEQPEVEVLSHAATGIVFARFPTFPPGGITQHVVGSWQPAAISAGGNLVVMHSQDPNELTHQAVWGCPSGPVEVMRRIKTTFDPRDILNPGRFVY